MLDISEVCQLLGTTSRTLRYYEEKGIIQSTTLPFQLRRRYDLAQIRRIKNVLVLRSLGLSIAKIQELQHGSSDLLAIIAERKAEIVASIVSKGKEIRLLDEALFTIENGGDIFADKENGREVPSYNILEIANTCTEHFLSGELEKCYAYFSEMLRDYMPPEVFRRVAGDTLKPIGKFVCKDRMECDRQIKNVVYCYLKYEKLGLSIKYVFHRDRIHGIWLNYCEPGKEGNLC